MSQINHRDRYKKAFTSIIDSYQHLKSGNGHIGALNYERAGNSTGGGTCKRVVRPNVSDFICDVELKATKALTGDKEALRFFYQHYQLGADVEAAPKGELNDCVQQRVGRMFIAVGIHPLHMYFQAKDCR